MAVNHMLGKMIPFVKTLDEVNAETKQFHNDVTLYNICYSA
jgi:hypothetical protein